MPEYDWEQFPLASSEWSKPGPYVTKLSDSEERNFQAWVKKNKVPWQDSLNADYDMRGYYKAMMSGDPNAQQSKSEFDQRMHFPDTWKTPFHKTFSNESKYATPDAPHWDGDRLIDKNGKTVADETPKPDKKLSDEEIKDREMLFPGYLKYLQEAGLDVESAFLPALGIIPTELHRMYGWFGKTAAEPEGQYNLGTGAPGSRRPKTPPPKED